MERLPLFEFELLQPGQHPESEFLLVDHRWKHHVRRKTLEEATAFIKEQHPGATIEKVNQLGTATLPPPPVEG